ncbi:hypothetical protein N9B82_05200 [Saprospiraceae bacterium]|nr:hypothetical protein [Saprospiraceae bacterium]
MKENIQKDQTHRAQGSAHSAGETSASLTPPNFQTSMLQSTTQSNQLGETLTPSKKTTKEL